MNDSAIPVNVATSDPSIGSFHAPLPKVLTAAFHTVTLSIVLKPTKRMSNPKNADLVP